MHNVETLIEGNTLIVKMDISDTMRNSAPASASGKTKLVASTGGAIPVIAQKGHLSLSLNLMTK